MLERKDGEGLRRNWTGLATGSKIDWGQKENKRQIERGSIGRRWRRKVGNEMITTLITHLQTPPPDLPLRLPLVSAVIPIPPAPEEDADDPAFTPSSGAAASLAAVGNA
jgi:hypothetical protein